MRNIYAKFYIVQHDHTDLGVDLAGHQITADPGAAGAITNECDYTGYAAVAVARSTAGWTTTTGVCTNDAAITFAECTAGSNTVTYFGICKTSTGDDMVYSGALTTSRAVSSGITPEFAAGDITITEA